MLEDMPRKKKRVNEARKRLFEYKGEIPNEDGSTSRKSFYSRISKEDAKRKWQDELNPPLQSSAAEGTFAWYFIFKYIPTKSHLSDNSRRSIQESARHLLPEIGHLPMNVIDATVFCQALSNIEAKKTCRNPKAKGKQRKSASGEIEIVPPKYIFKPLGASMVNKCRRFGLECHELACELERSLRPINPKRVPVRHEEPPEVKVYTPWQMRRLLDASKGTQAYLPVLIYGFLGITLREGTGLLASDLDAKGILHVRRQTKRKGKETTTKLKTRFRTRDLPLPPGLMEEIRAYAFGDGRLMRNLDGEPASPSGVSSAIEAAEKRAGLHRLTVHKLRHCFSSWLDENGCPRSVRLALMGQSRKAVQDRYNHPTLMRDWLGKLWEASFVPDQQEEELVPYVPVLGPKEPAIGMAHGRAVLDPEKVRDIRERLAKQESRLSIAKRYGVSWKTIQSIANGRTWAHVA